jgi:hypothetical protein
VYNAGQEDESFEWADLADLSNEEIRQAAAAAAAAEGGRLAFLYLPYSFALGPRLPQRGSSWRLEA